MLDRAYTQQICPCCLGTSLMQHYFINDFQLLKCSDCKFEFVRDIPSSSDLNDFYVKCYPNDFVPHRTSWRGIKYKLFSYWLKWICKTRPINLLEIGCHQGDLLRAIQNDKDFVGQGIDYAKGPVDYSNSFGLNVTQSDLFSMKFAKNSFDFILAFHVIEHVRHLELHLEEIYKILKPGGFFYMVVPSVSHIKAKISGEKWKYYGPPGHLWYYTTDSLKLMLKRLGFEIRFANCLSNRAHLRCLAIKPI